MANQGDPNVVGAGPFAVMNDCQNDRSWNFPLRKNLQDLRFGQEWIVQNHGKHLRMGVSKERPGNASRAAPRQGDFLAEGDLGTPREHLLLGKAFQLRGDSRRKGKLHQVHQIKVADEAESDKTRTAGMKTQGALDAVVLEQRPAPAHFFEDFAGQIFPFEKQTNVRLVEGGVVE